MQVPLELTFRHLDKSAAVESLIRKRIDKLEQLRHNIMHCRVAVERPNQHETSGSPYRVRIDLTVPPGKEIVVDSKPRQHALGETLQTVVNRTFDSAERQLKKLTERQRGDVKAPTEDENLALVLRKFEAEGYGFIQGLDGEEVYFHKNSVLHDDFSRLEVGTMVRYDSELGNDGPQATSVQIISKPGKRTEGDLADQPEG